MIYQTNDFSYNDNLNLLKLLLNHNYRLFVGSFYCDSNGDEFVILYSYSNKGLSLYTLTGEVGFFPEQHILFPIICFIKLYNIYKKLIITK